MMRHCQACWRDRMVQDFFRHLSIRSQSARTMAISIKKLLIGISPSNGSCRTPSEPTSDVPKIAIAPHPARDKPKQIIQEMRKARHTVDFIFALRSPDFASR
jgi:hypothetical protein